MKIIETPRLLLRRSTITEYREVFEHYTQQEAMAYLGVSSLADFNEERRKYDEGMTTFRTTFVYFHLIEKESREVIGDCCFHTWYFPHSRAEIGYGLKKEEHKKKGYMKEALAAAISYGFNEMELNRIEAFTSPDNIASQKLLLGAGFTQEGVMKEHYFKEGKHHDSLVFGLLKRNFKSQ